MNPFARPPAGILCRVRRAPLVALLAITTVAACLLGSAPALAAPAGAIAGTVTDMTSHAPIASGNVYVFDSTGSFVAAGSTLSDGSYNVGGLGPGTYKVEFFAQSYATQVYNGRGLLSNADPVSVTAGQVTAHVDAQLGHGGAITGAVSDSSTQSPVRGVEVVVFDADNGTAGDVTTDGAGRYSIAGLAPGSYRVGFVPLGAQPYARQYHSGKSSLSAADPVSVTEGGQASVDEQLVGQGLIVGTVTDAATRQPVRNVEVDLYDTADKLVTSTSTAQDGSYAIGGLATGSYKVGFTGGFGSGNHAPQFYAGRGSVAAADPVAVTAGQTTSADASLQPGAQISGTVTDASTNQPVAGVEVDVFDAHGAIVSAATTAADGRYAVLSLSGASYRVGFTPSDAVHVAQFYSGRSSLATADLVLTTAGAPKPGIDASLQAGGIVAGTVTDAATTRPAAGVEVDVYGADSTVIDSTSTDLTGAYTLGGLTTGSYRVGFRGGFDRAYVSQFFRGVATLAAADPVAVTVGQTTSGISASMAGGGGLGGTVTDASTHRGVGGVDVEVDRAGQFAASTQTSATGDYFFGGLAAGTYTVFFNVVGLGYENQFFNGRTQTDADPVTVTDGRSTDGIGAALAPGTGISGRVTDTVGKGIADAEVVVYDAAGSFVRTEFSKRDGSYVIGGLSAGAYRLQFLSSDAGQLAVFYKHAPDLASADPVTVAAGSTTAGIDVALEDGGRILGTVTDAVTGVPVAGVAVEAYDPSGNFVADGVSAPDGTYVMGGLATGSYRVGFSPSAQSSGNYRMQFYRGQSSLAAGDAVAVVAGQSTGHVDAALSAGGAIAGTVTDGPLGSPLPGIQVSVTDAAGRFATSATTDAAGRYSAGSLTGGSYTVAFDDPNGNYVEQFFDGKGTSAAATPVAVDPGQTVSHVGAAMQRAGVVTGTVTDAATGAGVPDIPVYLYSAGGAFLSSTITDHAGVYAIGGLVPGSYKLGFALVAGGDYLPQFYNAKPSLSAADPITVAAGTTAHVDAGLQRSGQVAGTVTDASTHAPVVGEQVAVRTGTTGSVGFTSTGADGTYHLGGLPTGTYKVQFFPRAKYVGQYYDNKPTFAAADPVSVTVGQLTGSLDAALQVGGSITGTLTDASTHAAVSGTPVFAYDSTGSFVASAPSGADGTYELDGLAAGDYRVGFGTFTCGVCLDYAPQFYSGKPSLAQADHVTVSLGQPTAHVDAAMVPGSDIRGTATDSVTHQPIQGVSVQVFDAAGNFVASATTDAKGRYSITHLTAANYKLRFASFSTAANYQSQYYDGKSSLATADLLTTTPAAATVADVSMQHGAQVAGTITDAATRLPINRASAVVVAPNGTFVGSAMTDSSGRYTVSGLTPGDYAIEFFATSYAAQYYSGRATLATADTVTLTAGSLTQGVDAAMSPGSTITGTVTDAATAAPAQGVSVGAFDTKGSFVAGAPTDANGRYTLSSLVPGSYRVGFFAGSPAQNYLSQYYNGASSFANALSVSVTAGQATTNIDAAMRHGAQIQGTVTDAGNAAPLAGIQVGASGPGGAVGATTDASGNYTLNGLPSGSYQVHFSASGSANYIAQYYNAKSSFQTADPVSAVVGQATQHIDAALKVGGQITGTITSALTHAPLQNIFVSAQGASTSASASTDAAGHYTLNRLPTDAYKLSFFDGTGFHLAGYYNGKASFTTADPVAVTAGAPTTGVDTALAPAGVVTGIVADAVTGGGVSNALVTVYRPDGSFAGSAGTDTSGTYKVGGLAPGSYVVGFTAGSSAINYGPQFFNGKASQRLADPVVVKPEAVTGGIDGQLTRIPTNSAAPSVTGTAQQDETLTEQHGTWLNTPTSFSYQWLQCSSLGAACFPISGATAQTYVPGASDVGHTLAVTEIATNAGGSSPGSSSSATAVVLPAPPGNLLPPTISGRAQQGQTLTEGRGSWTHNPTSFTVQWLQCDTAGASCTPIQGASGQTYSPAADDVGHKLVVQETASNAGGTSQPASSAATAVVVPPIPTVTIVPSISGTAQQSRTLTEQQGSWTNQPTSFAYQWMRCDTTGAGCAAVPGATGQAYAPTGADVGATLVVTETADNAGGTSLPASSAPTAVVIAAPPVNTSPPSISGRAQQNETLTEQQGAWTNTPTSFAYQWLDCDADGLHCTAISGATAQTYVPTAADVGQTLVVQETAANVGAPGQPAASAPTAVVVPPVPVNTAPPTISGAAVQGKALGEQHGSWTNTPTAYTYSWMRCDASGASCAAIPGATGQSYTPTADDVGHAVAVAEAASNAGGSSVPASSPATSPVLAAAPVVISPPSISGTPQQGQTLTEQRGSWTNEPTSFTYQWLRCDGAGANCTALAAATDQTYVPSADDVGHTLVVAETAANAGGQSDPARSDATAAVQPSPPVATAAPTISGAARQGETLTEQHAAWTNSPTQFTYQWSRCDALASACLPIAGATAQTYVPIDVDVSSTLRVEETATNAGGASAPATSAATSPVEAAPPAIRFAPAITGTEQDGATLTERHGIWTNQPTTFAYQWLRCDSGASSCAAIPGATAQSYVAGAADVGQTLVVAETASNAGGAGSSASSPPTGVIAEAELVSTATLSVDATSGAAPLQVAATIASQDADAGQETYRLSFGDGTPTASGSLPTPPIAHTYTASGSFLVHLAITDGARTTYRSATIVTADPAPPVAAAGDDQRVLAGVPVHFDGTGSRPAALLTGYHWDFGDGATADGVTVDHVYAQPGQYTARLTASLGAAADSDTMNVTVVAPLVSGLHVHVTGGGAALAGASVLLIRADGTRQTATADSTGTATIHDPPDGAASVYVWAAGFQPTAVTGTVANGNGDVDAALVAGEAGAATLESHRMTLDEIKAAGIDPADPANSHVYEAKIHLYFDPDELKSPDPPPGRVVGVYVTGNQVYCATSCGGGGGGGGGGGAQPCPQADTLIGCWVLDGQEFLPSITYVAGQPFIHWLVLPIRASFLKEFFNVQMIVQNLATGLSFSPGVASLQLPAGLSLAPLPTPQQATQSVAPIPGGQSRTISWLVRGDTAGFYDLGATYSAVVDPIEQPVLLDARTRTPIHVWGASALKTEILVDRHAVRYAPYSFDVVVNNVSDVPVYNMQVEMLDQPPNSPAEEAPFFYAPQPPQVQGVGVIAAQGSTTFHYVVFPGLGDDQSTHLHVVLEKSFIERTGGDVDLAPTLGIRTNSDGSDPSTGPLARGVSVEIKGDGPGRDHAVLSWSTPDPKTFPPGTSVVGYEVWTRQTLKAGPWSQYGGTVAPQPLVTSMSIPDTARADGRYYAIGTVYSDHSVHFQHTIGVGPSRYVSLGDSFSAGEGVPAFEPGTDTAADGEAGNKCHRSFGSYGRLLALDPGIHGNLLPATFAACSGAVTADVDQADSPTQANPKNAGEPLQIDQVNAFTDVISLSMGGNDIGFKDITTECILSLKDCSAPNLPFGDPEWVKSLARIWNDHFAEFYSAGKTCLDAFADDSPPSKIIDSILCAERVDRWINADPNAQRRADPANLVTDELYQRLLRIYVKLAKKAPHATIFVQHYPQVVFNSLDGPDNPCGLLGRAFGPIPELTRGDRNAIAAVVTLLNGQIDKAIGDADKQLGGGMRVQGVNVAPYFDTHELCRDGVLNSKTDFNSLVNPVFGPSDNIGPISYAFHPNASGQQAFENALRDTMNQSIQAHTLVLSPRVSTEAGSVFVPFGARTLHADSSWPGSTVSMSSVSPSGTVYDEHSPGVTSTRTATSQSLDIANPEMGTWHVKLFGDDVLPTGEPAEVNASVDTPPPPTPTTTVTDSAVADQRGTFDLSASGPPGATYAWTFSDGTVGDGAQIRHAFTNTGELWATATTTTTDGQTIFTPLVVRPPDTVAPVISGVPADISAEATSAAGATVAYAPPSADDNYDGPLTPSCSPAPGSIFALGDTAVTCGASDASGNTSSATFHVVVHDTTPPALSGVPRDITASATGPAGADVTYAPPTAEDVVDGKVDVSCAPASGTRFAIGATPVTCTTSDAARNAAHASFDVTVSDTTAPTITVPADFSVEATGPAGAAVTFASSAVDRDSSVASFACAPASGATFPLGVSTVTCAASDVHGNDATRTFRISVLDTTGPVFSNVPADITTLATRPDGATVTYRPPDAVDLVGGVSGVACAPPPGGRFPVGASTVTCTAADSSANSSTATFKVTVAAPTGATPPTLAASASPGITVGAGTLTDDATVNGRTAPQSGATVTFRLFGPNDASCSVSLVFAPPAVPYPAAGGTVTSPPFSPTTAGTYRWVASYSGDADNAAVTGGCKDPGQSTVVRGLVVPPAPSVPDLAAASDTGRSTTDAVTSDNTPTFTGTSQAGATVAILVDGTPRGSATATGGAYAVTTDALADGVHTIVASATDAGGNTSDPSGARSVTIDTGAPPPPSIPALADGSHATSDATPTFVGTAEDGAIVAVLVDGVQRGAAVAAAGAYTVTSEAVSTGAHAVSATATDVAGNTSGPSGALSLTIAAPGEPGAVTQPNALTFAAQTVATTSDAQSVKLTNSGSAPLSIASIALTGSGAGDFVRSAGTCGSDLPAGADCTVGVAFKPTASGESTALLRFTDDAGNVGGSTQDVALRGVGAPPVPVNAALPAISGTAREAQTLTATHGSWSASPTSLSLQWEDCDSAGNACVSIVGATALTYTLGGNDVGHAIRVVETAANAGGSSLPASSVQTAVVLPLPPTNTSPPSISGAVTQGLTLSEAPGSWTGAPTGFSLQWEDCDSSGSTCSAIVGATSQTYRLTAADVGHSVRVQETASNAGGSGTPATSAASGIVQAPPVAATPPSNDSLPAIAGTPIVGRSLSASTGTWSGSAPITYLYQWQRCRPGCADIPGATGLLYTSSASDAGAQLVVIVTAGNAVGRAAAASPKFGPIAPAPVSAQQIQALIKEIIAKVKATPIGAVLDAVFALSFKAPAAGDARVQWYYSPPSAGPPPRTRPKPVLVASGSLAFPAAGTGRLEMKPSSAGRKLLAHAVHHRVKRLALTARVSFVPTGANAVHAANRFVLRG